MNDSKYQNLVLTGFMATGKTTVAQLVAARLGLKFVDMDDEIVTLTGTGIPQIFEAEGEVGFRQYEQLVCEQLAHQSGQVIATGGGALINQDNLRVMQASGLVICLTAGPEAIATRLGDLSGRPLAIDWKRLLHERTPAYAAIPNQIDTSGKTPGEVAQEVIELWQSSM